MARLPPSGPGPFNIIKDVSPGLSAMMVPVIVVIGARDEVEHEPALREAFAGFLPQATFRLLKGIGHLWPLEAPDELADACVGFLKGL